LKVSKTDLEFKKNRATNFLGEGVDSTFRSGRCYIGIIEREEDLKCYAATSESTTNSSIKAINSSMVPHFTVQIAGTSRHLRAETHIWTTCQKWHLASPTMSAGLVYWSRIHPVLVPMALALEIVFFLRDTMFIADTWATRSIEC